MEDRNLKYELKAEDAKKIGHKIGSIFAVVCVLCVIALVVACTIKVITWMF